MTLMIAYNGHEVDFDSLPEPSRLALAHRGLRAYLGNEQASKVTAYKAKNADATAEMIGEYHGGCIRGALEAMKAGNMSAGRTAAEPVDPVEQVMRKLAASDVSAKLKAGGYVRPRKAETKISFPDASYTFAELVDRAIAKQGDALRKRAEAEIAAERRKVEKAKAAAGDTKSAEALDL